MEWTTGIVEYPNGGLEADIKHLAPFCEIKQSLEIVGHNYITCINLFAAQRNNLMMLGNAYKYTGNKISLVHFGNRPASF